MVATMMPGIAIALKYPENTLQDQLTLTQQYTLIQQLSTYMYERRPLKLLFRAASFRRASTLHHDIIQLLSILHSANNQHFPCKQTTLCND